MVVRREDQDGEGLTTGPASGWRVRGRALRRSPTIPPDCDGLPCLRRCGELYPGGRYLGYRMCHGLTDTSCREGHGRDAMWRLLGADWGMHPRKVKRSMERGARESRRFENS